MYILRILLFFRESEINDGKSTKKYDGNGQEFILNDGFNQENDRKKCLKSVSHGIIL